ncbi:MAG: hypothetical protein K0R02_699 [Rickettsiaceae bacterium]|jgi:hypothetical protein|nr:hypothetical protein [Rickettsiaceae bacterium]
MNSMTQIRLYTCLNKEPKAYGLKLFGLVAGIIILCLLWMMFTLSLGLIASMPAYLLGSLVSLKWYKGDIHKWLYWNIPTKICFRTKYIAQSRFRSFM